MSELAEAGTPPIQASVHTKKRRRRILIFCVVSLLNVGLLALLLTQLLTPASKPVSDPLVGKSAPNFSLAMLPDSKSTLSLSNFKSQSVVLNFWASWCDPCKQEAPLLESTWKQMQAQQKDVVFVGIDFQDASTNAISFLRLYNITYQNAVDANGSVASEYGVTGLPHTIFINRHGMVTSSVAGQLTAQVLASNLQSIL